MSTRPPSRSPGRPKDPAKRAAILDAAKTLFLQHGYHDIRMEQIARAAGVSKLTLYSHFGDKEGLLLAAVKDYCECNLPAHLFQPDDAAPLRQQLLRLGEAFWHMIRQPEVIAVDRMLASPECPSPRLAELFWQNGPERALAALAALLHHHHARGELNIPEPRHAAGHFYTLLKGQNHNRLLLGLPPCPSLASTRPVEEVVDLFLRAFRP